LRQDTAAAGSGGVKSARADRRRQRELFDNRTVRERAFSDNGAHNANLHSVVHGAKKAK
jgi:hypothetical protein